MTSSATRKFAGVLLIFVMTGCAVGGSGTGTEQGTGVGGPGVLNIGGVYYSGISPEAFQNLASELGVTRTALDTFLKNLGERNVPPEEYDQKLREIAKRNKDLQDELKVFKSDDPEVFALKRQAGEAVKAGEDDKSEALLHKAREKDIEAAKRSQQVEENRLRSAAATTKQLGDLKMTQLAYAGATSYYREAVELLPPGSQALRSHYVYLNGIALYYAGKFSEAEASFIEALSIQEKDLGRQSIEVAKTLNNLANVYIYQGRLTDAEPLYVRSLEIMEKVLGKEGPGTAAVLSNLAHIYLEQNRLTDAESFNQRALLLEEKAFGKQDPRVATTLNNIANVSWHQNHFAEAESLYQRALVIREKALGKEHPDVAKSLIGLANASWSQNRFSEAEMFNQRALTIQEKVLGKEHPEVAATLTNMARMYYSQRRFDEAEPLYMRALAIREKTLSKEHPDIAHSLTEYARLLRKVNRNDEAEKLEIRAKSIRASQ